jgi:hypothetical protein
MGSVTHEGDTPTPPAEPTPATTEPTEATAAAEPSATAAASTDAGGEPSDTARKERVLHTRIPAVLEAELKRLAGSLRVPVSNLVRTILEDALAVADRATAVVEGELQAAARRASDQREALKKLHRKSLLEDVIGYQPLVVTQETLCTGCGADLRRGTQAWLGIRDTPGPRVIACDACLPKADAT